MATYGGSGGTTTLAMSPTYVVAGAGLGEPNTFACGTFLNQTLLAYSGAQGQVTLVSSGLQRVVQVLAGFPHAVTSLAWSAQGKLAAGAGTTVHLYEPENAQSVGSNVSVVAWSATNELAVCGEEVAIWNADTLSKEWSVVSKETISQCAFSPDGRYLATVAQYQPIVKIWYRHAKDKPSKRSIYLPHPRSILSICWRPRYHKEGNILLSVSRDGIGRLWTESRSSRPFASPKFDVRAVLEIPDSTSAVEWLNSPPEQSIGDKDEGSTEEQIDGTQLGRISRRPIKSAEEYDFLCGIDDTGALSIWRVCSNSASVSHTPSVTLSIQLDMCLGSVGRGIVSLWAACRMWDVQGSPNHVELYLYARDGGLAFRNFDVAGIDSTKSDLQVTRRGSAGGLAHAAPIVQLAAAHVTSTPLVASLDSASVCHLWKLSDTTLAHTPSSFTYLASLPSEHYYQAIAWIVGGTVILASGPNGVSVYDVVAEDKKDSTFSSSSCEVIQLGKLEGSGHLGPLKQLHTVPSPRRDGILVIGIDSDRIALWTVRVQSSRESGKRSLFSRLDGINALDRGVPHITASTTCMPQPRIGPSMFSLATGHQDGTIRFWRPSLSGIELLPEPVVAFAGEAVMSIKYAGFYRFAATSVTGELTIWETESSPSGRWRLDGRLPADETGLKTVFEWVPVLEGSNVLVVGRGRHAKVYHYTRSRSMQHSFLLQWEEMITVLPFTEYTSYTSELKDDSTVHAASYYPWNSIVFLAGGVLLLASGSQIAVYSAQQNDSSGGASLMRVLVTECSALPAYHPHILFELMSSSRFRPVIRIFRHLLKTLQALSVQPHNHRALFIPDIPLPELLPLVFSSGDESKENVKADAYSQLWDRSNETESEVESSSDEAKWSNEEARELGEFLTGLRLGGVSGPEQMQLLAVAEALAKHSTASQDLDPCALRFTLSQRVKALAKPPTPLGSVDWLWALHSEAQDTLVKANVPEKATWSQVRELGLALWVRNPTVVRQVTERMAKVAFTGVNGDKREPMSAAIWYLALDKKTALLALFKAVRDQKMLEFFSQDFKKEEKQQAALKNAYFLLSKRKFELAITFFLLAGRDQLRAALNVCIKNLEDLHLAIWLARLIEGENGPQLARIIEEHLIPLAHSHSDPWLESIALWLLKRYPEALSALLTSTRTSQQPAAPAVIADNTGASAPASPAPASPALNGDRIVPRRRRLGDTSDLSSSRSGGLMVKEAAALPRMLDQGQELGTPALLQAYRLLRHNPQLRQAPLSSSSEDDEPILIARALYAFLHSRATFQALPLALEQLPSLDDSLADSLAPTELSKRKHLLVCSLAQLLAREVLVDIIPTSDTSTTPHLHIQIASLSSAVSSKLEEAGSKAVLAHMASAYANRISRVSTQSLALCQLAPRDAASVLCQALLAAASRLAYLPTVATSESASIRQQLANTHHYALEVFKGLEIFEEQQRRDRLVRLREEGGEQEELGRKDEEVYIRACVISGLLVASWARDRYSALELLIHIATNPMALDDLVPGLISLFQEDMQTLQRKEEEEDSEDEEEDALQKMYAADGLRVDRDAEVFLEAFLWLAIVNAFRRSLGEWLQLYNSLSKGTAPIGERLIDSLREWEAHLQYQLRQRTAPATADLLLTAVKKQPERKTSATGPSFTSGYPLVSATSLLFRAGRFHRTKPKVLLLWDALLQQKGSASHLENELAFAKEICSGRGKVSADTRLGFGDPVALYRDKDRDLVLSFAMSLNGDCIALSTVSGIREVVLTTERNMQASIYRDEDGDEWTGLSASDRNGPRTPDGKETAKDRRSVIAPWLESHPVYPYYASGSTDGSVLLWSYGSSGGPVSVFQGAQEGARITRVRFNTSGSKLGATDLSGRLLLWRFNLNEERAGPYFKSQVHSKRALELCWINDGSVLATGGTSRANGRRRDVALWDVLMPHPCVAAWNPHPGGAHSLVYSPRHQLLISGGKDGDMCLFDLRQRALLRTIGRAHGLNVKSLVLSPDESLLVSASTDGSIKLWDLPTVSEREHWPDAHEKRTFMKPTTGFFTRPISTYGAMEVDFACGRLLSCGADGRLLSRPLIYDVSSRASSSRYRPPSSASPLAQPAAASLRTATITTTSTAMGDHASA